MTPEQLRKDMVEEQIIARGIKDRKVLAAVRKVPRHEFVRPEDRDRAYDDGPLPIGHGQTISQPYMVALMTECLRLDGTPAVLEIGTGSGYQTAVLAEVSRKVVSFEQIGALADRAREILARLNYSNVEILAGDGVTLAEEYPEKFDAVIVTAACPQRLDHLFERVTPGGRMVVPIGERFNQQLTVLTKAGGHIQEKHICGCVFVPLTGRYGWSGREV